MRARAAATLLLALAGGLAACTDSPTQQPEPPEAAPPPNAPLVRLLDDPMLGRVLAGLEDAAAAEAIRAAVNRLVAAAAHGARPAAAEAITGAARAREGYAAHTGPSPSDAVRLAVLDLVLIRARQLLVPVAAAN